MKRLAFAAAGCLCLAAFAFAPALAGGPAAEGKTYKIEVDRSGKDQGTLKFFVSDKEQFSTTCWWKADKEIPARTYTGCSTTTMAAKGHKAVYLPDAQTGMKGIFIHPGTKPEHSDGCIVIATDKIESIYDAVPRDSQNITVVVSDS